MTYTVDHHLDGTRLTYHQQWLNTHAEMVVEQYLVHLHRVLGKMELAIGNLHRIHIFCRFLAIERHDEDALTLILFTVYHTLYMALPVIGLLTAQ